jgi:ubiquinone/menaquinone biosynthesis C-methylase UbiE
MEHKHHAKSSAKFLDADEILSELNLKGNEAFMDAGCGDGYISKKAISDYLPDGIVYAVDVYDASIDELDDYKKENNLENLINIKADISKEINDVDDRSIDVALMINVIHGFDASGNMNDVIEELSRTVKDDGRIAIVDFNPIDWEIGPPKEIKCSPEMLEEIFNRHGLEKVYLNDKIGQEGPEGNSHYLIIFEKE